MSSGAFIDGIPLVATVNWQISEGVDPFRTVITLPQKEAFEIIRSAKNKSSQNPFFTLTIESNRIFSGPKKIDFKNLVLEYYKPNSDPRFIDLHFADNRVFWSWVYFKGDFNIRSRLGDRIVVRYLDEGFTEFEALPDLPIENIERISYRTYSLWPPVRALDVRNELGGTSVPLRPWTPKDIILRVLDHINEVLPFELGINRNAPELDTINELLQEDIQLDGQGNSALKQIMDLVPQIGIYVNKFGEVNFFEKHQGGEIGIINSLSTPMETDSVPIFVDNSFFIPSEIEVIFEPEIELRFDYIEFSSESPSLGDKTAILEGGRFLENVIEVPDPSIEILDLAGKKKFTAFQGQYVNFDDYLNSLEPLGGPAGKTITREFLRQYILSGYLDYNWANIGRLDVLTAWPQRIDAMKEHFRKTFRINKMFRDRMVNLKANRLSTVSVTEGFLSPSPVFMDYAKKLTYRGAFATGDNLMITNFEGYAPLLKDSTQCPWAIMDLATVPEQGVIKLAFKQDPFGHSETIYPSKVVGAPTSKVGDLDKTNFLNDAIIPIQVTSEDAVGALDKNHEMSTIMSATPAPVAGVKYYSVVVTPGDLPAGLREKLRGAKGPRRQIKIPAARQTARFVWEDARSSEYSEAFGLAESADGSFREVVPNFNDIPLTNADHIRNLAIAEAQALWKSYVPRYRGSQRSELEDVEPSGTINEIQFQVDAGSTAYTSISISDQIVPPNWIQLLKKSSRAFIQRFVKWENS